MEHTTTEDIVKNMLKNLSPAALINLKTSIDCELEAQRMQIEKYFASTPANLNNTILKMWNEGEGNNKLQIVKYVKDVTGWGLKESKDHVDNLLPTRPFPSRTY